MIFELLDGRNLLYQWDLNRKITVNDESIKEVHFCNKTDDCSLVVEVVDGLANIPNILLQSSFDIRVYGYDGEATLHEEVFKVKARTRPADYVYTETEVLTVSQLAEELRTEIEERLNEIEEGIITDGFATTDYVDEAINNVSVDFSGYAKESYVDEAITQVRSEHTTDLDNYAKKTDIPDVSNFITEIPSEYITETELNAKGYLTDHQDISGKADVNHTHSEYAKTKHTHDQADINGLQIALSERATQADIDKAIELHNHNSLYAPIDHNHDDKYSTRGHVHSYNDLANKPTIPSIEGLATEAYVNAAVKNAKPDLTGYATEEYVDTAIANIEIPEGEENNVVLIKRTSTDGNKIQSILDEGKWPVLHTGAVLMPYESKTIKNNSDGTLKTINYYFGRTNNGNYSSIYYDTETSTWSSFSQIYLASKDYVDEAISKIEIPEGGETDLSNYYTKEEVDNAIANIEIPDDTEVIELVIQGGNASASLDYDIRNKVAANPEKYIFKVTHSYSNISNAYYRFSSKEHFDGNADLSLPATDTIYYSAILKDDFSAYKVSNLKVFIQYNDNGTAKSASATLNDTSFNNYYTKNETYNKTEIDEAIANIDIPESEPTDLTNYYTKDETYSRTEVDEALANSGGSGGASYTFTNGLTETNGTVSWDLNSNILKKSNNIAIGFMDTTSISGLDGNGCVAIGRSLNGKFYSANQGNVALGYAYYGALQPNGTGSIAMGYAKENYGRIVSSGFGSFAGGMADSKQINSTSKSSFAFGVANATYGEVYSANEGSAVLGCGVQTTTGLPGQFVVGRSNVVESDKMFIVGNGTKDAERANLFTVDTSGNVNSSGTMTPTGADYAEYFEFEDGNLNKEDRIGLLVELVGNKIQLANGTDILGAISGTVGVIGDAEEMSWHGKYETDEFGRFIYEDIEVIHSEGTEEEWIETINTKKISKDYDPNMTYIPRSKRPEWAPVGLMGKVFVRQDGTLNVGDYVAATNGIATKSEEKTNIRVLEVMSEGIVRVLVK